MSTVNGTKFGKMKKKVNNISGMFWASDLLDGRKPIPQKQKQNNENDFQNLLDVEIKRLKEIEKMSAPIKTDKTKQISSCFRLVDKNGKSYKFNRKQRRAKKNDK